MKKFCISFFILAIIILSAIGLNLEKNGVTKEYLRIHVRAHSNLEEDQSVKYLVKDAVVEYLTPFIAECDTKKKAERMLKEKLSQIERVANQVLKANGKDYLSKASVREELFPTRVYKNLCLENGFYDALILNLGSGEGDNWWCVVYPPLCFTGEGTSYVYKSKIKEIIDGFFYNQEKKQ